MSSIALILVGGGEACEIEGWTAASKCSCSVASAAMSSAVSARTTSCLQAMYAHKEGRKSLERTQKRHHVTCTVSPRAGLQRTRNASLRFAFSLRRVAALVMALLRLACLAAADTLLASVWTACKLAASANRSAARFCPSWMLVGAVCLPRRRCCLLLNSLLCCLRALEDE